MQTEGFRQVLQEMKKLHDDMLKTAEEVPEKEDHNPYYISALRILNCGLLRNKRYALAYLKHRMEKIETLRWETGAVLPKELRSNLNSTELDYFQNYNNILGNYMRDMKIDITSGMTPPKDLLIEVRVVEACGEIFTDHGPVTLDANTTHFLRRGDVEHLIRQGKLQQTSRQ
eukprot:g1244.t1